jgi:hypothetical protein
MSTEETLERLHQATLTLCADGAIKDRLADAWATHLTAIELEQVPADLRIGFDTLRTAMNREAPLPRESVARASVRKMSSEEASGHAQVVVQLFARLARAQRSARVRRNAVRALQRPTHMTPVPSAPVVQLFAKEL